MEMKKNNALFNASRHLTYGKEKKSKARRQEVSPKRFTFSANNAVRFVGA
jgi:hypothetical protein